MVMLFCEALIKLEEHLMFYIVSWKHVTKSNFLYFCFSRPFTWQVANVWPTRYGLLFERISSAHEVPQVHPGIQFTQFPVLLLGLFCVGFEVKMLPYECEMMIISMVPK